jgi:hypothetical protein
MMTISECRDHAMQCRELARTVSPRIRDELLRTAEMWARLADDQEAHQRKEDIKAYIKTWASGFRDVLLGSRPTSESGHPRVPSSPLVSAGRQRSRSNCSIATVSTSESTPARSCSACTGSKRAPFTIRL